MDFDLGRQKKGRVEGGEEGISDYLLISSGQTHCFLVHILQKIPAPIAFCCVMLTARPIMQCSFKCTLQIVTALLIFSCEPKCSVVAAQWVEGGGYNL